MGNAPSWSGSSEEFKIACQNTQIKGLKNFIMWIVNNLLTDSQLDCPSQYLKIHYDVETFRQLKKDIL